MLSAAIAALVVSIQPGIAAAQGTAQTNASEDLPSRQSLALSTALSRLSRDPRNVDALVDAGNAASDLGDFEAAVGFFKRGQALAPRNPRLLAGLAGAMVRQGNPAAAIPLFAQAETAGGPAGLIAGERGLAHDLVGDPATAQTFYAKALAAGGNTDEVLRRLAISQAISGDGAAMEKTLLPLLKKQDKPSWRARAFGLAILGDSKEAIKIVKTLLPGRLADSITPYLQYMPRLTPAQQAAAANLGIFPRASEIGRDETKLASTNPAGHDAGSALVPAGKPLGKVASAAGNAKPVDPRLARQQAREAEAAAKREAKAAADRSKREALAASQAKRVAPPEPMPTRDDLAANETKFTMAGEAPVPKVAEIMSGEKPAASSAVPKPAPQPAAAPAPAPAQRPQVAMASAATPPPAAPPASPPAPRPGFDLGNLPAAQSSPVAAAPAPAPAPSFGAMFADLGKPTTVLAPPSGAVDIRQIEAPRPKPKLKPEPVAAKPPPPSHPSRIWVQLGIGQKVSALTYDWRKMEKSEPALFKGRKPFSAKLNQTNRLLTGPFASQGEAAKFINALEKAGVSGPYMWVSPAGEVVDELSR